jgi:hypothetical protein
MPVRRNLQTAVEAAARQYPVVTVTGPRQSGKTTLARMAFPDLPYVTLEPLDRREQARSDPRGLLAGLPDGAVLDEVQHVPELLSYLQAEVDERPRPGRFILTGSQHFGLSHAVSQSLAGRTAVLHLLPLALDELLRFSAPPTDLLGTLWAGGYPRIHDRGIPADRWLADYVTTYVQRDVRQVTNVSNLTQFTTFLRLCAGRSAQELNLSALGADAGISHVTARAWLSVLETSFLCTLVPAWSINLRKRLVKAPKLHFHDTGLVCQLLGIASPAQLREHPLRGAIFETWVAAEVHKARVHRGLPARLHHVRASRGSEVDLVAERGAALSLIEAKSGATVSGSFLRPLLDLARELASAGEHRRRDLVLVHGGDDDHRRHDVRVLPWRRVPDLDWGDAAE